MVVENKAMYKKKEAKQENDRKKEREGLMSRNFRLQNDEIERCRPLGNGREL